MEWTRNKLLDLFPSHRGDMSSLRSLTDIFTDSRKKTKNGLFIPIVGERFDGHRFLKQAIEQGAAASLWQVDRPLPDEVPSDFPIFLVNDTVAGLQKLAKCHLEAVHPVVIAVTGSNGKTTTKDMIEDVLNRTFRTHKTEGNFNNHIGLPLTVLAMREDCEVLILEMGMNHFGEISALSRLAEPDHAVITNIGESHIEFLGSREGIAKAKMEITEGLKPGGKMVFDGDEPLLAVLREQPSVACGYGEQNDLRIGSVEPAGGGLSFSLNEVEPYYKIPLLGKHNVKNATFAIAIAQELGMTEKDIVTALQDLSITNMRFEQVQGKSGSLLINDAYNASPTSMKASIESVRELDHFEKKVLVLGDMHELGTEEKAFHESVAESIRPPITDVITIGDRGRWIAEGVTEPVNVSSFETKEEAAGTIEKLLSHDTVVLFKASRLVGLETLVKQFAR
ncbi:MAG TPA: UDP-N-acetylmuramoyl-tripeptide--D-alanyl-D-alanine ligase [Bacillales bacterium]|nr:UDP-N-acetylmuramoyl-tripeptide--D-alanyl-D-alanine ligase [Bacillales bacterium]